MTIAAHIASSAVAGVEQNFRFYILSFLAEKYPQHHFIFIFDRPFDPAVITQQNITPVLLGPQVKNNLLRHYWYNFKIPSTLNRYQADVFLTDGICCSLRTNVRQCMLIPDLAFMEPRNSYPAADVRYIKKYLKRFTSKASTILVHSNYIAETLKRTVHPGDSKVQVIPAGGNIAPSAMSPGEQGDLKSTYTAGKEYFIAFISSSTAPHTISLLKAFSAFKKRQLSSMRLLLIVATGQMEALKATLTHYKYRDEVKTIDAGNDQLKGDLVAASYAALFLPVADQFENSALIAYRNNIPLITTNTDFQRSMFGDAAMYVEPDEKDIAEKMMVIYKDENLRSAMVNNSKTGSMSFSIQDAADKLWDVLAGTALQKL
jgi:hypothetical protein